MQEKGRGKYIPIIRVRLDSTSTAAPATCRRKARYILSLQSIWSLPNSEPNSGRHAGLGLPCAATSM